MKCVSLGVLVAAVLVDAVPAMAAPQAWIPAWYVSPEPAGSGAAQVQNETLRQIVRIGAAGTMVRLRLSNAYGADPLKLDDVRVAKRITGSRIDAATDTDVTFNGHAGTTIAPGAYVLSDPLPLAVAAESDLAVSLYVSGPAAVTTFHDNQRGAIYTAAGDLSHAVDLAAELTAPTGAVKSIPWLDEVEVSGSQAQGAVVAFGDSITDGYGLTPDSGHTWPDVLNQRLLAAGIPLSVVNAGISGNRLLHNGQRIHFGETALARFDRDVLAQPNVAATVVLIGINDLGHAKGPGAPEYVSAQDIIDGLSQIAERAHERGIRVYAATLTPFKNTVFADYYSDEKETQRLAINAWIRQATVFDGVIDFDKAVQVADNPALLRPDFDHGDHLHPNDLGAAAMANAVPLSLFDWAKPAKKR